MNHFETIVIGAGMAGLAAANELHKNNRNFALLEASKQFGGRIRSQALPNSTSHLELGAEFVQGSQTLWKKLLEQNAFELIEITQEPYVFQTCFKSFTQVDNPDLKKAFALQTAVESGQFNQDISLAQFFALEQLSPLAQSYLIATLANEYGLSPEHFNLRAVSLQAAQWPDDGRVFALHAKHSFSEALDKIFVQPIRKNIHHSQEVKRVDYQSRQKIIVHTQDTTYTCAHLIVSIPLSQLQQQAIEFYPELPKAKYEAMKHLKMSSGFKQILQLKQAPWPADAHSFIDFAGCTESWLPQASTSQQPYVTLYGLGKPNQLVIDAQDLVNADQIDWGREPFIEGLYSSPLSDQANKARSTLAQSLEQRIHFAGEATHFKGQAATMNGALESGLRAAEEILKNLQNRP